MFYGGAYEIRTRVQGFADLCLTPRPTRQNNRAIVPVIYLCMLGIIDYYINLLYCVQINIAGGENREGNA